MLSPCCHKVAYRSDDFVCSMSYCFLPCRRLMSGLCMQIYWR